MFSFAMESSEQVLTHKTSCYGDYVDLCIWLWSSCS